MRYTYTSRSSLAVMLSVWKALFLREAVTRVSKGRSAWVWLILEPVFHVVALVTFFSILRMRMMGGVDMRVWVMVGILSFLMFKHTALQAMNAINANEALFAYRQVKPVDTVLVRAALEGFLMVLISVTAFLVVMLFGLSVVPEDPLVVLAAFLGMWMAGLGFGLLSSVAVELMSEVGTFVGMALTPIYFLSGVMFQIGTMPSPYRAWLLWNPLIHGIETARHGFATYYQMPQGISLGYLYVFSLATIFFGLALHNRFAVRLATK